VARELNVTMDIRDADPRAHIYGMEKAVGAVEVPKEPLAVLIHGLATLHCQQDDSSAQETYGEAAERWKRRRMDE
jgi:hypothetical protein